MIQATELRIGNIVTYHGETDMDCVLDAIDIFNIATKYMHNDEIHSPIVITEEWLLKFDFIQQNVNGETVFIFKDNEWYFIENVASNGWASLYCYGIYCATDIQYVHQLQNLYFALTGEELTIKTI